MFVRAWTNGQPLGFGRNGTVETERVRIWNPPVLIDDPNGTIMRESFDPITGQTKVHRLSENPAEALRQDLAHTISLVGKTNTEILEGSVGNTTDTFYSSTGTGSTTCDGRIFKVLGSAGLWSDVRDGDGNYTGNSETDTVAALEAVKSPSPSASPEVSVSIGPSTTPGVSVSATPEPNATPEPLLEPTAAPEPSL